MLCGLLGGKFFRKCKHSAKNIRTRVVPIRNKKQATVWWLKKDVADLIAAGHEANAYGRIDALMVEINHTSCYDIIDQHCLYILNHLPDLKKQRECPREAMEAIATLIFAAARFFDLPELRDLRRVFNDRYGSSMDSSINAEFVDKIQEKSFSKEKKLQLMQSIAEEFSVRWDSKRFEHLSSATPGKATHPDTRNNEASPVQVGTKEKVWSIERYPSNPASIARKEQIEADPKDTHVVSAEIKTPARATSMLMPELLNPNGGRVLRNMPDYFQLAARLAASRNT
ncbi:uncharacterized protein LOC122005561 [Zingiber officinale]|uniref:uncharacterized protein LOC122005561 n=1 Tax=Zingiber officinale TaxID=94328 RepID=UPI001C4B4214|nr:uncharacterized protein LOC122005561 [Zingiber officinale]XP_042416573.1 uncharacterized protein LOC122005561 [Zingiber officinale]XP_042416574.1 uncharacterized protein LOC122005561 [Zingiber officinale]